MKNILFVLLLAVAPSLLLAQNLEIHWPLDRAVFQRNGSDQATVVVQGQYSAGTPTMKYRLVKLKLKDGADDGIDENWTDITPYHDNSIHKIFHKSFTKTKGWYRIDFSTDGSNVTKFIKFGIGDVYVIAGQSNAQGFNPADDIGLTNYFDSFANFTEIGQSQPRYGQYFDCVNATAEVENMTSKLVSNLIKIEATTNIKPRGYHSHCYAVLGAEIALAEGVPTFFINTAYEASSIWHWNKSKDNPTTSLPNFFGGAPDYPAGQPYKNLKNVLNIYNSLFGIRAILWLQGESDNRFKTAFLNDGSDKGDLVDNYQTRLNSIIGQSRTDFKNTNNNITWFVSQTSFEGFTNPTTNTTLAGSPPNFNSGIQYNIGQANRHGVISDIVGLQYPINGQTRQARNESVNNKVHFTDWGLYWLGKEWASKQPWTGNPITAEELLPLTISGTQLSISPVAGATNYMWVKNDNIEVPLVEGPSTTTFNYANDGGVYRCYVIKDGKNYLISEAYKSDFITGIEPPPSLYVGPNGTNFSSSSQTFQVTISSPSNWTLSSSNWIHPNVTSGFSGNNRIVICNIDANVGTARHGIITVTNNNESISVDIYQQVGFDIVPTPTVKDVGVNSFYTTANINGINTSWTATKSDGWFTISPTSGGSGFTNMAIQINANGGPSRTGTIYITGSGISRTITINQTGSSLNPCYDCVGYLDGAWCPSAGGWAKRNGQTSNFDIYIDGQLVQANVVPNFDRPDVGGYFGLNYTYPECYRNGQNHEIVFKFAGTSTALTNSPKIFNCTGGNCSGGNNTLSASPTSVSFTNSSGSQNTTISSTNVTWNASESLDWLTLGTSSGGNGNTTMPINALQNTTSAARTGVISVSGGGFSNVVSVLQNSTPNNTCINCEGYLDGAWCPTGGGWAKKNGGSTNIDIYIDGQLVQSNFPPNYNRPDVGGYFGFVYSYPECYKNGQNHSLSYKHAGTNTELINSPQTFNCSGGNCNSGNSLTVSNGSLAFISQISSQSVNVNSTNVNWSAAPSVGWITVTPSNGINGITNISISVQQNTQNTSRIGSVNISGGGYSQTINITQDGASSNNTCNNCEGYLDGAWCPNAGGWAKKNGGSTTIDVYIDGQLEQSNLSPNYNRPDVGGYYGFIYNYPECKKNGQNHSISFKHSGTSTELINSPQIFNCTGGNCGARVASKEEVTLLESNLEGDSNLSIFPNPTNDKLTAKFGLTEATKVTFEIVDTQGRKLAGDEPQNYNYKGEAGLHTFIIDVSKLNAGSYILRGMLGNKLEVRKFVVER